MSKIVQRQAKLTKRLRELEELERDLHVGDQGVESEEDEPKQTTTRAARATTQKKGKNASKQAPVEQSDDLPAATKKQSKKGGKATATTAAVKTDAPEAAKAPNKKRGKSEAKQPVAAAVPEAEQEAAQKRGKKRKLAKKFTPPEVLSDAKGNSNVVYIGHIPQGFEEKEIRKFFDQFGDVVDAKLTRSKQTGNSRGFGFVKFSDVETARIAAQTMNGYYIYERQLVCNVVPTENVHDGLFKPPKRSAQDSKNEDEGDDEKAEEAAAKPSATPEVRARRKEQRQQSKKRKLDQQLAELGVSLEAPVEELEPVKAPTTPKAKAATPARKTKASAKKK